MEARAVEKKGYEIQGFDWPAHCAPLMAEPGRWAVVAEYETPNNAQYGKEVCARQLRRTHGGRWQLTCRRRPTTGRIALYVRYLGPGPLLESNDLKQESSEK